MADYPAILNCWIIVRSTLARIRAIRRRFIIKKRSQLSPLTPKLLPTSLIFFLKILGTRVVRGLIIGLPDKILKEVIKQQ